MSLKKSIIIVALMINHGLLQAPPQHPLASPASQPVIPGIPICPPQKGYWWQCLCPQGCMTQMLCLILTLNPFEPGNTPTSSGTPGTNHPLSSAGIPS